MNGQQFLKICHLGRLVRFIECICRYRTQVCKIFVSRHGRRVRIVRTVGHNTLYYMEKKEEAIEEGVRGGAIRGKI